MQKVCTTFTRSWFARSWYGSWLPCYVFFLCMLTNGNSNINKLSWIMNPDLVQSLKLGCWSLRRRRRRTSWLRSHLSPDALSCFLFVSRISWETNIKVFTPWCWLLGPSWFCFWTFNLPEICENLSKLGPPGLRGATLLSWAHIWGKAAGGEDVHNNITGVNTS